MHWSGVDDDRTLQPDLQPDLALTMFELDSMPDLLKPCGLGFPRHEEQYNQLIQDILVTKSDIHHSQEVS